MRIILLKILSDFEFDSSDKLYSIVIQNNKGIETLK